MVRIVDHFINHVRHNPTYTARRKAHVAVITSVAGTMGIGTAPAYSATKKMQSTYLVALSQLIRMERLPITLSDIRPGFVRTEILNPEKHYPMVISCERAAQYTIKGLARRKRIITFDWRYRCIVFFWRMIPRWLWERMTFVRN
jgi:short-subunit dehydrogenase